MTKYLLGVEINSLVRLELGGPLYYVIDKRLPKNPACDHGEAVLQSQDGQHITTAGLDMTVEVVAEVPKVRVRGFEPVLPCFAKAVEVVDGKYDYTLPARKTAKSSGYDFVSPADFVLAPGAVTIVPTNIKAYMLDDEELLVSIRSGLSTKGIMLMNPPGKIDADFYGNEDNDGNISFIFWNMNSTEYVIKKGDRIGQGTFYKYLKADDDNATGTRTGGLGSTGR